MSVKIKDLEMGQGRTKICVPIIGKTREDILKEALDLKDNAADIVEWRVDFYEDVMDVEKVLLLLDNMVNILGNKPVLFTFRTKEEGGERQIDACCYKKLLISVIEQGKAGAIDVELFKEDGLLEEISKIAGKAGIPVIASNHDFEKTPDKDEIVKRLISMKDKGASISKIALIPNSPDDVLKLLNATYEAKTMREDITLITMSMGKLGVLSRLGGGVFGSAMTFGAKTKELASAPGQVEVNELRSILEVIE